MPCRAAIVLLPSIGSVDQATTTTTPYTAGKAGSGREGRREGKVHLPSSVLYEGTWAGTDRTYTCKYIFLLRTDLMNIFSIFLFLSFLYRPAYIDRGIFITSCQSVDLFIFVHRDFIFCTKSSVARSSILYIVDRTSFCVVHLFLSAFLYIFLQRASRSYIALYMEVHGRTCGKGREGTSSVHVT